jgi:hypothetical protein
LPGGVHHCVVIERPAAELAALAIEGGGHESGGLDHQGSGAGSLTERTVPLAPLTAEADHDARSRRVRLRG